MASSTEPRPNHHHHAPPSNFFHSATAAISSLIPTPKKPSSSITPSKICLPFQFDSLTHSPFQSSPPPDSVSPKSAAVKGFPSAESSSGFPSTVRIAGLNSNGKGGGPAFVGQVFSMCDLSGTGLMAVSTHFDIPFLSKRTPEWLKKMYATVTKSQRNGPVFRFFMDLGDAVTYVKRLNIPTGVVGACRLDLAYEHFKEKPHLFQFVPNEKQVKAANQLLRTIPQSDGKRKVEGVPVFTAQNLDIAIATADGIKWYTPYFFDKRMLDNILEESVDQHFHSLIQTRHMQRRRDVVDDSLAAEVIEEMGDNMLEPPEVQEMMDEIGHHGIPFSVISKAAEIQLLNAVDRVLLGNRWLRKATGIQPKFPYMVDSFEKRSAFSSRRSSESTSYLTRSEKEDSTTKRKLEENAQANHTQRRDLRLPFGNWSKNSWLKQLEKPESELEMRSQSSSSVCAKQKLEPSPFLPKITMVGISTGDSGQMSKASLKKTMEDLTRELEQADREDAPNDEELEFDDRDPLFVANVGDYYSRMSKTNSPRWVRGGTN
ncbi:Tic22-like family protein [Euphorbia peplus]|nr:Tic22-like family protein [Euphorbia peplus]